MKRDILRKMLLGGIYEVRHVLKIKHAYVATAIERAQVSSNN